MKTGIIAPIVTSIVFLLTISCSSTYVHTQTRPTKSVTVEALSDEISYNLDLQAVASVFANSRNLEDFEYRINDYESGISNLDLNRDGQVDYLRVVEMYENNVHLVVIQAVLDYNVFQDVATVVVEKKNRNNVHVQIIGDPYIYGVNYIIEPVYYAPPVIYTTFWAPRYVVYRSPYYWGHYPRHYHYRAPIRTNIYVNNIHVHIDNHHHYRYSNKVRNQRTVSRMQTTVRRNDYATRNPQQSFNHRNSNVRNTREMQTRSSVGQSTRSTTNSTRNSGSTRQTTTQPNAPSSTRQNSTGTTTRQSTTNSNRQTTQPSSSTSTRQSGTQSTTTRPAENTTRQTTTQPATSGSSRQSNGSNSSSGTVRSNNSGTNSSSRSSSTRQSTSSTQKKTEAKPSTSTSRQPSGTTTKQSGTQTKSSTPASTRSSGSGSSVRQSAPSSSNSRSSGSSSSSRSSGSSSTSTRSSGSSRR